jgi:hypothetical protein
LHTVSVEQQDAAGNISAATSLSFTLDTTAPTLTGITASPESWSRLSEQKLRVDKWSVCRG